MSIPTNEIVFAGVWSSATAYRQYDGVVSPIDSLFYVYIGVQPITGGSDPSVQPSTDWVNIPSGPTGDITGIVAGDGLVGGGSTGQVNIANSGVISLNGQAGDITTAHGSFSSTAIQSITANTVLRLEYDTTDVPPVGVSLITGNIAFAVTAAGVYKVLASVQLDKTTGGNAVVVLFPSVDEQPVPNSSTFLTVNQNQQDIMTIEWFLTLTATQVVSINLYTTSSGCRALAVPAELGPPAIPAVPSIIATILRIA